MLKNYLKIAWRNLERNKMFSLLNIVGLATGMSVAILIGLWVWDELSFNKYHKNYDQLAQVMVEATNNNEIFTGGTVSIPMGYALRDKYGSDFKSVALVSHEGEHVLAVGEKKISQPGVWAQHGFPDMFSLEMTYGSGNGLKDPSSILIAESVSRALFNDSDPINQTVRIDNKFDMKVAGVYKDLPYNTDFRELKMILPWEKYLETTEWVRNGETQWGNHLCRLYTQLAPNAVIDKVTSKIRSVPTPHIDWGKEEIMLHPMSKWHLHSEFKNGKIVGGKIGLVRLMTLIGVFVLLLACINFMNLSTARSGKRSREVGIRKTVGSLRGQLIVQFLSESITMTLLALGLALLLVQLAIPFFNQLSDKDISLPWNNAIFWLLILGFSIITGLLAGSYPAFYLSGFKPVKVLKGTLKNGPAASLPRKILVISQFTVSVALIIGTIIVYKQIQHASNRPVGYTREGLVVVKINTPDLWGRFDVLRNDLINTGAVADMALSNSEPTKVWSNNIVDWKGKDPSYVVSPGTIAVSHDFGNTVQWKVLQGRDFSRSHPSDTFAFILNESAVKMTGFKDPVGKTISWLGKEHEIIGVVKDMVMESPYQPIRPTIFHLNPYWASVFTIRVKPTVSLSDGLAKIENVFKAHNPGSPFVYQLNDEVYAKKFEDEKRIANLTTVFSMLAVLISCLGLFGLASYIAEQRTKEIGIRKVLGASVFNLWKMLSKDFVALVMISCAIAIPIAYYFLNDWLQQFEYRTTLSWWIFVVATVGAIVLTLLTVTWQALKAAVLSPVKSLKSGE